MPYIAIKTFPKDMEIKQKAVEQINEIILELWNSPPEAVTISVEEFTPDEWELKVKTSEIVPKMDKMLIIDGKRNY